MQKQMTIKQKEAKLGINLVLPSLLVILLLILYPVGYNIYLSFFDITMTGKSTFTGIGNYTNVILDPTFWNSVLTTFTYVVFSTLGTTAFGLVVALVMNKKFHLRWLVRSIVLLPYVAPVISVVFAWQFFFDPVNGIFMHIMVDKFGFITQRFNLIGSPEYALWIAIIFSLWKSFPFTYLMLLAQLQSIDKNLYEAAEIDGCGPVKKFFNVTLPELYYVMGSIVLLRFIWNFNKFEEIYLLTDNVKVLSIYTYFRAFTGNMDLGQGSALVVIQFILLMGLILFYVKKVLKW